jgi:hypothetical protein
MHLLRLAGRPRACLVEARRARQADRSISEQLKLVRGEARSLCPSELSLDLASTATRFSWIGPDTCHDQHDCSIAAGDGWLRQTVGTITSSPAWQADAVLFITWDEDGGRSDNRVLTLVLRPDVKHRVSAMRYDHYSLLATIEDILGVPRLANAATATPTRDLIG